MNTYVDSSVDFHFNKMKEIMLAQCVVFTTGSTWENI